MTHARIQLSITLFLLGLLLAGGLGAQEGTTRLRGGSWTYEGRRIEIGPETIGRHVETLRRLEPVQPRDERLRAAWQRAFRVETARALGLGEDEEVFLDWMARAHAAVGPRLLREGKLTRPVLEQYAQERGFSSLAAYEDFCRDEYRGRCFIDHIRPPEPVTEGELRRRFDAIGTQILLDVIAVAPETLDEELVPDPADPEARAAYGAWYARLPDHFKLTLDDREHPALEAEAIYVDFRNRSPAELHAWFTEERSVLDGRSIADLTADLVPDDVAEARIYRRWVEHRRGNLAFVNADLPGGLSDAASYELVEDYLIETWKTIKYLERVWETLRADPTLSLADEARRRGLRFRHLPMQVRSAFDNDAVLPGDHSQPLLKNTEPGEILDYNTGASAGSDSPYFAEGVVDQPGLHASIFRLVRKEPMRVRSAEEVRERAWPEFVRYGRWQAAQQAAAVTARNWRRLVDDEMARARTAGEAADPVAARGRAFVRLARDGEQIRLVERLHVRPFGDRRPRARSNASLGRRLQSFIEWRWSDLAKAGADGAYHPGLVLDFVIGLDYRVAALARIRALRRPSEGRWERDRALRERARRSLEEDRDRRRIELAGELFSIDRLREAHELRAPDLDAKPEDK